MRNVIIILALVALYSCTISDKVDYTTISKAVVQIKPHFNEDGQDVIKDEVKSLIFYIFDDQQTLYRIDTVSESSLSDLQGIEVTYLYDGNYTIIAWANANDQTHIPSMEVGKTKLAQAYVSIKPDNSGDYISSDPLMYGLIDFKVKKGDFKIIDADLQKSVYRVTVSITGIEFLDNPTQYYFAINHTKELDYYNQPKGEIAKYKPALKYDENQVKIFGEFNILKFRKDENITIGIYNDNSTDERGSLFETSIQDFIDHVIGDMDSGGSVTIPIEIIISTATIEVRIADWSSGVIQRADLGS